MFLQSRTAVLAAICILVSAALYGADKSITVALIFDGSTQEDREPLRAYLTKAMGRPVKLVAPDLYSETVAHLADGSYDFACLGALMYIRARAKYGVIPLVRRSSDLQYHSVFITGANSSIYSLRDLQGKRFAFGDINAASIRLIDYLELAKAGIDPENDLQLQYSGSHVATAALVESGVVDAGALDETIFNSLIGDGKLNPAKVRVFFTSRPFVSYVYVARKDVPEAEQEKFAHALLALKEGKDDSVLKILRAKQFVVAKDEEYAKTRQIAHELKMF
ncbi:MAG: phosphate/phosphite/phosphonate ABC transporter substrate-binding protein [Terriglobales bacterium]|jgi:phosphonate transport system substrate-binding protein